MILERATGIEPATSSLGSWHSTAELRPLMVNNFADALIPLTKVALNEASVDFYLLWLFCQEFFGVIRSVTERAWASKPSNSAKSAASRPYLCSASGEKCRILVRLTKS